MQPSPVETPPEWSKRPLRVALVLIAIVVTAASLPALFGTWVYDDLQMLNNPMSDDPSDVLGSFSRNSGHYFARGAEPDLSAGFTYRPLTHISLTLVNGLVGPNALLHHTISLLLHLCVVALLLFTDRRIHQRTTFVGVLAAAVFGLHPSLGETWLWINGRSDLLAGVWVAAAAFFFASESKNRQRNAVVTAGSALFFVTAAVLSKEPAIAAAGIALVAFNLPQRVVWSRASVGTALRNVARPLAIGLAATVSALGIYLVLRNATLDGQPASFAAGSSAADLLGHLPLLVAIALETVLSPVPRPMRLLGWEFQVGWNTTRLILAAAAAGGWIALVFYGRIRSAVLLFGALFTLFPTAHVAQHDWLGFDRYLYLPLLLASLAAIGEADASPQSLSRSQRIVAAFACILLAGSLHLQARIYRSHTTFVQAIVTLTPESGIGQVRLAELHVRAGRRDAAIAALDALDADGRYPVSVIHAAAAGYLNLGLPERAAVLVEREYVIDPTNPLVLSDVLALRAHQRRWDEVTTIATQLLREPHTCALAHRPIRNWLDTPGALPPEQHAAFDALLRTGPCASLAR